jgi:hypothetical protein
MMHLLSRMVEQVRISSHVAHRIGHQGIIGRFAVVKEIELVHQLDVVLIQLLDDLRHDACAPVREKS